ncbi:hypothetical protein J6S37_02840 [Candidatus Saccharibacteria bacterium]|nr:hypothetical protein [Candidatus Saccharibacteria bacterium]
MARSYSMLISLILLTFFVGLGLSSNYVLAEEVVDEIAINVPVSCSVSGIGMNSHNTTLAPGAYDSHVGETTAKVFCNDREGFAVYAIGYTDEVDGKNVMTSTISPDYDIVTGTATTGNSQWAMKLALVTSPTPTYPVSIQNGFDSFHTVPDDYTLVIKRESATDVGISAEGASFTSTLSRPLNSYSFVILTFSCVSGSCALRRRSSCPTLIVPLSTFPTPIRPTYSL